VNEYIFLNDSHRTIIAIDKQNTVLLLKYHKSSAFHMNTHNITIHGQTFILSDCSSYYPAKYKEFVYFSAIENRFLEGGKYCSITPLPHYPPFSNISISKTKVFVLFSLGFQIISISEKHVCPFAPLLERKAKEIKRMQMFGFLSSNVKQRSTILLHPATFKIQHRLRTCRK